MAAKSVHIIDFRTQIPGKLSKDKYTWVFPVVESTTAHGKKSYWEIYVKLIKTEENKDPLDKPKFIKILDKYFTANKQLKPDIIALIDTKFRIGEGKIKKTVPTIIETGKNIGRASETNIFCQALREALSAYNKQCQKVKNKYEKNERELYPPMLAQLFKDQKNIEKFPKPLFVQRKYNGVRAMVTKGNDDQKSLIIYSRRRKIYSGLNYLREELSGPIITEWNLGVHLYLDGELYSHETPLQTISGQARRETNQNLKFDYMIYDCFLANEPEMNYSSRLDYLKQFFSKYDNFKYAKFVQTYEVKSVDEIYKLYDKFISEGYEGAMVRLNQSYRPSWSEYHSKHLLKIKPVLDGEFTVVGWDTGRRGKNAGALMIICETKDGKCFPVTPALTIETRMELAKKMPMIESNGKSYFDNKWKDKKIIVEFEELSIDKIPQRARTKMEIRTWD